MTINKAAADTLEKVSREFESQVLADLQEGEGQALDLVESTKRDTHEVVAKILQAGAKQAESLRRQIIGAAELEARNAQLRMMDNAVNQAFSTAVSSISKASQMRYGKAVVHLIREGIEAVGPEAVVSCSSGDIEAVDSAVRKLNGGPVRLTVDPKHIDTVGGVVLATVEGLVRFDNTFEARLERMRQTLRKEVAALLGGKG
jgi:V/A-type H+-transporting ATPase subunit E